MGLRQQPLIVGVGNEYRGDDAIGLLVVRDLRRMGVLETVLREESGEGSALMDCWKNMGAVILVDAVRSGSPPGTIHRFEAHRQPIPAAFAHFSSHAFGVAEAIELSRVLTQLPDALIVYGIEGKSFAAGTTLSSEVEYARNVVIGRIVDDLAGFGVLIHSAIRS